MFYLIVRSFHRTFVTGAACQCSDEAYSSEHLPFLSSNIPSSPAYGFFFISQSIQYAKACSSYEWFNLRAVRLSYGRFSGRDMLGNVWNHFLRSPMVDMGTSSNNMKSTASKCYMIFWDMTIYIYTIQWSDISLTRDLVIELDLFTDFDIFTKFREVSTEHLQHWCV